jgi:hypothetical protein
MGVRKPFICRHCKAELAFTDGIDLYFGVQKVPGEPLRVSFLCPTCKRNNEWHSDRKRKIIEKPHHIV